MRVLLVLTLLLAYSVFVDCQGNSIDVTLTPEELSVDEGEDANFTCSPLLTNVASSLLNTIAPGSTNAESIENSDTRIDVIDVVNSNTSVRIFIWLSASLADHGRQFFCLFGSSRSNIATLYINQIPSITINGSEFTRMAGESLYIPVTVAGWPEPMLSWTRDGSPISVPRSGLNIPSVSLDDAGMYNVIATNSQGSDSENFAVIVTSPPVFAIGNRATVSVRRGDRIIINCAATAYPPLTPDNITLTMGTQTLALDGNSVFIIESAVVGSAGDYVCTAVNEIDTRSATITVEVGDVPDKVTNIDIKVENEDDSLEVKWVAGSDNGASIQNYIVEIKYEGENIMRTVTETMLRLTREELKVEDDGAKLTLTVTITAVNGIGSGEPTSAMSSIEFEEITPTPPSRETQGASATSRSALFSLHTVFILVVCSVVLFV